MKKKSQSSKSLQLTYTLLIVLSFILIFGGIYFFYDNAPKKTDEISLEKNIDLIENGIHVRTGLVEGVGLREVVINCTTCHSSKLIMQNRMGEEQWNATIRWMQQTQGLWPLGENQKIIVAYLVKNYPPLEKGRRPALTNIEWYELRE